MLDDPRYLAIVNSCGWPPTKVINIATREEFLHGLVNHELLGKRETQVHHLCQGMELLSLVTLIKAHPRDLKPVLVYDSSQKLTSDSFLNEVDIIEPKSVTHEQVLSYFKQYVLSRDTLGKLNEQ